MSIPASLGWFAAHEIRLSWRDFLAMMTGGRKRRERGAIIFVTLAAAALHLLAWAILGPALAEEAGSLHDRVILTAAMMLLPSALMVSQAMEAVTRVFYARSDLDLIFGAPVDARRIFAIRIAGVACSTTILSLLLAAPAINILAILDSPAWLAAYPVTIGLGLIATIVALVMTMGLFATIGAARTRLAAQIAAAIVGAGFIVGIQLAAIASMGTISRIDFLRSGFLRETMPGPDNWIWIPAKAAMGEPAAFVIFIALAATAWLLAFVFFSGRFAETVLKASGVGEGTPTARRRSKGFAGRSIVSTLRHKEWKLLARDHWLVSQTLMQVFYLVPPAFMLWQGFGAAGAVPTVVVPVLVMACGQLAGGLAWLAISGEDAPQLVATAPINRQRVIRAKVEAVLGVIALLAAPLVLIITWFDAWTGLATLAGIMLAAGSAVLIQFWFKSQARRSNFRRRQTSSKVATFAEAFSSILWAACAGLAAHGSWYGLSVAALALAVLLIAHCLRPAEQAEFA